MICVCFSRHTTSAQMPHGANEARRCPRPRVFQLHTSCPGICCKSCRRCDMQVGSGWGTQQVALPAVFFPNHSILFLGPLLPVFSMRYFACWSGLFIYHNYSKLKSWTVGSWNETKLESSNQQFWSCLILGFIEVRLNRPGALEQQPTKCMSSPLTPCVSWCLHFLSLVRFTFSFFSAALTINKKQVYADKSGFNLYIHFGAGLVQGSPVSDSIKVFQQPLWLLGPLSFFSSLGSKPWGTLFFPSMDNFVFSEENKRLLPRTTAGVLSFTHTMFVASAFLSVFYLTAVGVFRRLTCHMLQRDAVLFSRRGSQEMWQGNEG